MAHITLSKNPVDVTLMFRQTAMMKQGCMKHSSCSKEQLNKEKARTVANGDVGASGRGVGANLAQVHGLGGLWPPVPEVGLTTQSGPWPVPGAEPAHRTEARVGMVISRVGTSSPGISTCMHPTVG
eukprot:218770-Hanusia_phi.AAC.1